MKIIGVVGGMGSGKSTVVHLLNELTSTYIINADHIGHAILKKGNLAYRPVIDAFGEEILGEDQEIDRGILGSIVFSDPVALQKLNRISHPLIYKKVKEAIQIVQEEGTYAYIIIDAALLVEIKLIELVDEVWGVYVPLETQIERVMGRNKLSKEEALKRISSQLPWEKIKQFTHYQINNGGTITQTKAQIEKLLTGNSKGLVKSE